MWFELGRTMGQGLESQEAGLEMIRRSIQADLNLKKDPFLREHGRGAARLGTLRRIEAGLAGRLASVNQSRSGVEARRDAAPAEFSWVKGLLYMGISILLIFADVAILGQVIAQFLGYPWYDPDTDRTFAQLVFTVPSQALRSFPDLFFLTLALLLIGFFVKIWKDWYAIRFDEERGLRRTDKLKFVLYTVLVLLALLSVGLMAGARFTIDLGSTSGTLTRAASALLGLALPLVSAGFFLEGYDCLAARGLLWRLSFVGWFYRVLSYWTESRRRRVEAELEAPRRAIEELDSSEHRAKATQEALLAFSRGYTEGVKQLLAEGAAGSLYERLRPIAVRRLLVPKLTSRVS